MKKTLTFLFTLFQISIHAQTATYHPFPDSNAVWNIEESVFCLWQPFPVLRYSIVMEGDTSILSTSYHKLNIPFVDTTLATCLSGYPHYGGSVRQDVAAKMVYIIPPYDSVEQILYDFNLNVGDTVFGYLERMISFNPDTVVSIDSVLIGNDYRKRWLICQNYSIYIIEGIGSTYGLLEASPGQWGVDFNGFNILCFKQDSRTLYPDTNYNCELINGIINPQPDEHVSIFPNPITTESVFTLETSQVLSNMKLLIFNPLGELVREEKIENYSSLIQRGSLLSGMYFFRVSNGAAFERVGKLVVR